MSEEKPRRRRRKSKELQASVNKATEEMFSPLLESDVKDWISTTCTLLDLAITGGLPGGIPVGRISHFFGAPSTCKSALACALLGSIQRKGGIGYYADIENTLSTDFSGICGLDVSDTDSFKLGIWTEKGAEPTTVEELYDEWLGLVLQERNKKLKLAIADTLTVLPCKHELKGELSDGHSLGERAKKIGAGLRKYNAPIAKKNLTLVFLDQTRTKMNAMFGEKETTSGGVGVPFYSSVRVHLKHLQPIKNDFGVVIGGWLKFQVVKNKVGEAHAEGKFRLLYKHGIDDTYTNLYFLKEHQLGSKAAAKASSIMQYRGREGKLSTILKYIEDNDLEEQLEAEVVKAWKEEHVGEERKPRKWKRS